MIKFQKYIVYLIVIYQETKINQGQLSLIS